MIRSTSILPANATSMLYKRLLPRLLGYNVPVLAVDGPSFDTCAQSNCHRSHSKTQGLPVLGADRIPQHTSSTLPRMLVVFKNDMTVTNGRLIPHSLLDQSRRASWKIMDKLRLSFGDPIDVNDIDVRSFADGKRSSVFKADHSRLGAGQFADCFFQTEGALVSMPVT